MRKYQKHIIVLLISVFIGGFVAIHAGQDQNFDLYNYHYVDPHSFLHNRVEHDIAPGELESYDNPISDIPSYLLITHFSPRTAAGALGMIQGLNIWVVFEIMLLLLRRIKAKATAKIVVALGVAIASFFGAASLSEVGNTMGDNLVGIFVLLGVWGLLYSFAKKPKFNPTIIRIGAFALVGIGAGLKLTNAVYVVGLLGAGLVIEGSLKNKIKEGVINALAALCGMLVSSGFWYLKMWQLFRNPIFPFYNGVFKSPYYQPINFVDKRWHPASIQRAILFPYDIMSKQSISSEIAFKDPRLAVALSLLILLILVVGIRKLMHKKLMPNWSRESSAFCVFFLLSYVLWLKEFAYYRYLIPIELLCLVMVAVVVYSVIPRFAYATAVLVVAIAIIASVTVPINWGRIAWRPTFFGVTQADFAQQKDSVVLMAGYAPMGFIVPYLPSSSQVIRIGSDLSAPGVGTPTMQAYMRKLVQEKEKSHAKFYALRADEEQPQAEAAFNSYGFKTTNCRALDIYSRENLPSKIRLCQLISSN